jgi:isochorismate synthase EntC
VLNKNNHDKEDLKMVTQLQPTPTLYGEDAKAVLQQIQKAQTPEQKIKAEERRKYFQQIRKRGL